MTRLRALIAIGLLSTAASAPSARPPAADAPGHLFRGRVLAARSGAPLPRARVAISGEAAAEDAVLTGDDGRFLIPIARPSGLIVTITKAGYAVKRVRVASKDVRANVVQFVRLEVGAAVSGRVVQPSGRAAVGVNVAVGRANDETGKEAPAQWLSETDDRGEYRVGSLPAGRYIVKAGGARETVSVTVKPGDDLNDVNLIAEMLSQPTEPEDDEADAFNSRFGGGTAVLQGRVVSDLGEPLPGARIRLLHHGVNLRSTSADANGGYVLRNIAEGRYTVQAITPGYVTLEYGQRRSTETGRTVHLRDDGTLRGIEFVLPRGNAITGNVVDEHGQPVEGAVMRALQLRFVADRWMAQRVPGVRERRSDDRGQYRLFGLLPGTYLVSASIDAAVSAGPRTKSHGYASSYYPGTANISEAWPVHVDVDRDMYGAHLVLAPSSAVRIAGTVHDSQGNPLKGLVLLTTSRRSRGVATEPRSVQVAGGFVLNNVPPGDYVLQATGASHSAEPSEFVAEYVRVTDADVSLSLKTSAGATMEGSVQVEGETPYGRPPFSIVPVPADSDRSPVAGHGARLVLEPGGHFRASGLHGAIRLALYGGLPGWYLKAVTINGSDATDTPFEFTYRNFATYARVVISPHGGTIRGRVIDERNAAVSEYTVVVFAADRLKRFPHARYTKFARPSQDDSFEVTGLPPGEYRVAAVRSLDATVGGGEWQNPETLEKLAAEAQRVRVEERDVMDLTVRMAGPAATRY